MFCGVIAGLLQRDSSLKKIDTMTAKELRQKFETDLNQLQDNCKHEKISDWMDYEWAPGHSSPIKVRTCAICEKIMDINYGIYDLQMTPINQSPK